MNKKIFFLLEGFYYAFVASVSTYLTAHMLARGQRDSDLSFLGAGYLLAAMIGSFVWGELCDHFRTNRKIFLVGMTGTILFGTLTWLFAGRLYLCALFYALYGFVTPPMITVLDAWLLRVYREDAYVFGHARGFTNVVYAVVVIAAGFLVDRLGYGMLLPMGAVFGCGALLCACMTRDGTYVQKKRSIRVDDLRRLMRIAPYSCLIGTLFLVGAACGPFSHMKIVIIRNFGGSVSLIGIADFIACMLQAPLYVMAGRLRRLPCEMRILIGTIGSVGMLCIGLAARGTVSFTLAILTSAVGGAVMNPTVREITERTVPDELKNTGHSVVDGIYSSFAGVVSMVISGLMIGRTGITGVLTMCIAIGVAAIGLSAAAVRGRKYSPET